MKRCAVGRTGTHKGHAIILPRRNIKPPCIFIYSRGAFRINSAFAKFFFLTIHFSPGHMQTEEPEFCPGSDTGPAPSLGRSRLHVSHLSSKHLGLDNHYSCPFQVFLLCYHFTMFPCMSSQLS